MEHDRNKSDEHSNANANGGFEVETSSFQLKTIAPPPLSFESKKNDQEVQEVEEVQQDNQDLNLTNQNVQQPSLIADTQIQLKSNTPQEDKKEENDESGLANSSALSFDIPPILPEPTLQLNAAADESPQSPSDGNSNPDGLPNETLTKMNSAFDADFSGVNIHKSSSKATDAGALAYAQGNDVHFAPGQFNPESNEGQKLIGHELTHVVQQANGRVKPTKQAKGLAINDDPGLENEADKMGEKAANAIQKKEDPESPIRQEKRQPVNNEVKSISTTQLKKIGPNSENSQSSAIQRSVDTENPISTLSEAQQYFSQHFNVAVVRQGTIQEQAAKARRYLRGPDRETTEEQLVEILRNSNWTPWIIPDGDYKWQALANAFQNFPSTFGSLPSVSEILFFRIDYDYSSGRLIPLTTGASFDSGRLLIHEQFSTASSNLRQATSQSENNQDASLQEVSSTNERSDFVESIITHELGHGFYEESIANDHSFGIDWNRNVGWISGKLYDIRNPEVQEAVQSGNVPSSGQITRGNWNSASIGEQPMSLYSLTSPGEDFAESIRAFQSNRNALQQRSPARFNFIQNYISSQNSGAAQTNETAQGKFSANNTNISQEHKSESNIDIIQKMEASFGTSFQDVNIHKDSSQATDAGALAYAKGNDVHFAPGQFKPDTKSGQELIGHELTHVVQQRQGRVKPTKQLKSGFTVNDDPALEKEADEMGAKAAEGNYVSTNTKSLRSNSNNSVAQRIRGHGDIYGDAAMDAHIEKSNEKRSLLIQLSKSGLSSELYKQNLESLYKIFDKNSSSIPNEVTFPTCLHHVIITLHTRGEFSNLLYFAKNVSIEHLKSLADYSRKTLCQGLSKVLGSHHQREATILIQNIENPENLLPLGHVDLIWNLNIGDIDSDKVVNILSSNTSNQLLIKTYDNTFTGNFSKNGLKGDIDKKLKHDNRKKALILLTRKVIEADEIVFALSSTKSPDIILNIFKTAMEKDGFSGIQKLVQDWKKIHIGDGYEFDPNLFKAIEKTIGKNHQAVHIINSYSSNYEKMPEDEFGMCTPENKERELRLSLASSLLIASVGSKYKDKVGYENFNDSKWTGTLADTVKQAQNKKKGLSKPKDYNEQIHWAIKEIRTIYQEKISEADEPKKSEVTKKWNGLKVIIEQILFNQLENKNEDTGKFATELNLESGENLNSGDQFFFLAQNKKRKELVRFSEKIWANNELQLLHDQIKKSRKKRLIFNVETHTPRKIIEETIGLNSKNDHAAYRILIMIDRPHLAQEEIGTKRILHEFNRNGGKIKKDPFIQFIRAGSKTLIDKSIDKYLESINQRSGRKNFLELIKQNNNLKEKDKDYKDYRDVIVPAESVEIIEERAQERYDDSDAGDYTKKSADEARLALAKIKVIVRNQENLDIILKIKGAETLVELANKPYEELIAAIEQLEKEIEADRKIAGEMLKLGLFVVLSVAIPGAGAPIAAAFLSKLGEMSYRELSDPDGYEFSSSENFKEIATDVLVSGISLGLDKFAKLDKIRAYATKYKSSTKTLFKGLGEEVLQQTAKAAMAKDFPDMDKLIFDLLSKGGGDLGSEKLKAFLNKKGSYNALSKEVLDEIVIKIPTAIAEATVNPDVSVRSVLEGSIKSLAAKGNISKNKKDKAAAEAETKAANVAAAAKKTPKNDPKDSKESNANQSSSAKENDDTITSTKPQGEDTKNKKIPSNLHLSDEEVDSLFHDPDTQRAKARKHLDKVKNWKEATDSLNDDDPIKIELDSIRLELKKLVFENGGTLKPEANTLPSSDLDFQFNTSAEYLKIQYLLSIKYGPDYKEKFDVDIYITSDRIKNSDQINDPVYRATTEKDHAQLVLALDLIKRKKTTDKSDPKYQHVLDSIERLPPELKAEIDVISKLEGPEIEFAVNKLLVSNDDIEIEINKLQAENPKNTEEIDLKRKKIDENQIRINALKGDAYTAKSFFGGENLDERVSVVTELSNQLTLLEKVIYEGGGLEEVVRNYKLYKYLHRGLDRLENSDVQQSEQQKNLKRVTNFMYGYGEDAFRKFYEEIKTNRSSSEMANKIGEVISELHQIQQNLEIEIFGKNQNKSNSVTIHATNKRTKTETSGGDSSPNKKTSPPDKGNNIKNPIGVQEAKIMLQDESNIEFPERWKRPIESSGENVIIYRGFSSRAQEKMENGVLRIDADRGGGTLSRDYDAANDAVLHKVGKKHVKNGLEKGGVVKITVPSEIWDLLLEMRSISEDNYPGFRGNLSSTEIRVNSNAAIRIINSLPQEIIEPKLESNDEAKRARANRSTAKMPAVKINDKDVEENTESPTPENNSDEPVQPKLKSENNSDSSKTTNNANIPSIVNVHTESSSAKDIGALAYAQGTDIHFAPGHFKPDTKSGQELIGHELHHVKQQKEGRVNPTKNEGGFSINDDHSLEKEADDAGKKFSDKQNDTPFQLKAENSINSRLANENNSMPFDLDAKKKKSKSNEEALSPFKV